MQLLQKNIIFVSVKYILLITEPGNQPDTKRPVNNSEAFCSVTRTRLNKHSMGRYYINYNNIQTKLR